MVTITLSNGKVRGFNNDEGYLKVDVSPCGALVIRDRNGGLVAAFADKQWVDFDCGVAELVDVKSTNVVTVEVTHVDTSKGVISAVKLVREVVAGMGLKDAKDLVDGVAAKPRVLLKDIPRDYAERLVREFANVGATLRLV